MIAMTIRALADARSSVNPSSSAKAASAASASGKDAAAGGTFFFPSFLWNDSFSRALSLPQLEKLILSLSLFFLFFFSLSL